MIIAPKNELFRKDATTLKMSLNRLVSSEKIVRLSKGQFYKPEITDFGTLRPSEYQVVKDLLEDDQKIIPEFDSSFL